MQATPGRRPRALFVLAAALSLALVGLRPADAVTLEVQASTSGFIVLLNDGVDPEDVMDDHPAAAPIDHVYEHAVKGFAGVFSSSERDRLARDSRVRLVERDRRVRLSDEPIAETQTGAPWGLDRIDQVPRSPLSGTYTYLNTGAGVTAYVIDTGIRYSHNDFSGRAEEGFDAFGGHGADCHGHGTHVAGTIGGEKYGVAKDVTLVSVRVLDCSGYGMLSGVIAGVNWVSAQHDAGAPAVANMSLGAGKSTSLDTAVANSIKDGVSYAIAAGNGNFFGATNACNTSPARVSTAMTVGATDKSDRKASWSNYGSCVDWFAPGVSILSAWNSSDSATATVSGTSMAAPHTAGVAALYLQSFPTALPSAVRSALNSLALKDIVGSTSTNDHLLYKKDL